MSFSDGDFPALCVTDLARSQAELTELAQLIQRLHWLEGGLPITNTDLEKRISMQVSHLSSTVTGFCFTTVFCCFYT